MYSPSQFAETDTEVLHALIRANPLATLVTLSPDGLEADHIPLLLGGSAQTVTLCGHVARANPLWRHALNMPEKSDVLAIFHGPDAYITPSWYATKQETGKVVPTWNYATVHVCGTLRVMDDAKWLRAQLEQLTAHNEAAFDKRWAVSDAPHDFTEKLLEAIVGIEITVTRMTGKWKVSQNQPAKNQVSVIDGLRAHGKGEMADLVEARRN